MSAVPVTESGTAAILRRGELTFKPSIRRDDVFEAFLPARRLPGDYFEASPLGTALVGRRGGGRFRLGDPIEVRVRGGASRGREGRSLARRRAPEVTRRRTLT